MGLVTRVIRRHEPSTRALPWLAWALFAGACSSGPPAANGACSVMSSSALECAGGVDGGATSNAGLIGYSCTGSARPDDAPSFIDGVPRGAVCTDRGTADGERRYCCTTATTPCAYNPVAVCGKATYGYQCRGSERPDALNSTLVCGQGLRNGDLVEYCCSGTRPKAGCLTYDAAGCASGLDGWACNGDSVPTEEDLGPNESRADYTFALCGVRMPAPNPDVHYHCCYTPKGVPIGGSCVQHASVPGCEPGNFGFACYGPERPEDDYPPMHCAGPGVPGRSAEGYPASLYCCTFQQP